MSIADKFQGLKEKYLFVRTLDEFIHNVVLKDLKMRPELRMKLTDNSARLVSELDVTTSFLVSLSSKGVITEGHKAEIQVNY